MTIPCLHIVGEYYVTADSRCWKIGKIRQRKGKKEFLPQLYYTNFDELCRGLLEIHLLTNFSANTIKDLEKQHKDALKAITAKIHTLATSEKFQELAFIRNEVKQ